MCRNLQLPYKESYVLMLIDSHCHLDYLEREGRDLPTLIEHANAQGIKGFVTISTKLAEADKILEIAGRFKEVFATIGCHPHQASHDFVAFEQSFEKGAKQDRITDLLSHPKVVGIGETGLDYYYNHSDAGDQRRSFLQHIDWARQFDLPLVIHCRDADDDMIHMLTDAQQEAPFFGLIHCFTGSAELAACAFKHGMYVSFSGVLTFKKADELREIAKAAPLEQILVETDSPYLAPVPMRGKPNEPAYVIHTARALAEIKGLSFEDIAQATTQNCRNLFTRATFAEA